MSLRGAALLAGALGALLARGASADQTHLVIVVGLGGEPGYTEAFDLLATSMVQAAEKKMGVPVADIAYYGEKTADAKVPAYRGRSTRENVTRALESLAGSARPGDLVFILLIGHGSFQAGESRLSLPGPDMTAADFAPLLARLSAQQVVLVNTASASGDWLKALGAKGRTIVTATRSGMERNETEFPRYFVEAFTGDKADADKDQRVSVLEAYAYAKREVERFYEKNRRLLTEHALLDDDGDGVGTPDVDGRLARTLFLGGAGEAAADDDARPADPRLAELRQKRGDLERRIGALKAKKEQMAEAEYEDELETLLLELARQDEAIRTHGGSR